MSESAFLDGEFVPVGAGALFSTGVGLSLHERERFFDGGIVPARAGALF